MVILLFALLLPNIGPDTDILIVSRSCEPCIEAKEIIQDLKDEGYDVKIINRRSPMARMFDVEIVPTLIVRKDKHVTSVIRGLKTEDEYRDLLEFYLKVYHE